MSQKNIEDKMRWSPKKMSKVRETLTSMYFEPLQYGSGMQQIVRDEIYDNPRVGIREMISNARDQYLDLSTESPEHYNKLTAAIHN
jgi:hypothetical protein